MAVSFCNLVIWLHFLATTNAYRPKYSYYDVYSYLPKMETEVHDPGMKLTSDLPRTINGTSYEIPSPFYTSDYRIEESPYLRYSHYYVIEEDRPYRISPFYKQYSYWPGHNNPYMLGCGCTTVFKKYKMLATCAVLTIRHVLTTATSTEIILRKRRSFKHFEGVLGVWYDISWNSLNSSMYATPARIHYHPRYVRPLDVNRSHPLPTMYDLSLWTMTHRLYGGLFKSSTIRCERGTSYWLEYGSSVPRPNDLVIIVGYQFMKAFKRVPLPWMKYAVRSRDHVQPCPKTEWGWFHCLRGNWAKLGLDSGANMHRSFEGRGWRYNGLIGMNTVSMKLRSYDMIHYFTVLDTHPVINFLYNSYMGLIPHEFLDFRFEDTKYASLQCKEPSKLYWNWEFGDLSEYYNMDLPNY